MTVEYNIILDTNFLLVPFQHKIDIFAEIDRICHFPYKLCIIDRSLDELKSIIEFQKGKNVRAAKLAIDLLKAKDLKTITTDDSEKDVDHHILDLVAGKSGNIVATLDKYLRDKLRSMHVPIIHLKCRGCLELEMYT